jgi:hypothetical protein
MGDKFTVGVADISEQHTCGHHQSRLTSQIFTKIKKMLRGLLKAPVMLIHELT